ncbi:MAG: hypothetical protein H0X65_10635 [Gemmatimonadetes bacterium]|nr:hypothetical protein [Gemmatimonadota bacterium]
MYGTRDLLRLARDDEERRGVIAVGALCTSAVLAFLAAIAIRPTALAATIGFLFMITCFYVAHFVWLPRITARRHAAELEEDPIAAACMPASASPWECCWAAGRFCWPGCSDARRRRGTPAVRNPAHTTPVSQQNVVNGTSGNDDARERATTDLR